MVRFIRFSCRAARKSSFCATAPEFHAANDPSLNPVHLPNLCRVAECHRTRRGLSVLSVVFHELNPLAAHYLGVAVVRGNNHVNTRLVLFVEPNLPNDLPDRFDGCLDLKNEVLLSTAYEPVD